jgi:hypothetical protein
VSSKLKYTYPLLSSVFPFLQQHYDLKLQNQSKPLSLCLSLKSTTKNSATKISHLFASSRTNGLISLLQPVSYPEANIYDPSHNWTEPPLWDRKWPQESTSVVPDTACEICTKPSESCVCISSLPKDRHKIVLYAVKGEVFKRALIVQEA